MSALRILGVFIAVAIVDIAWARYIQTVSDRQPGRAALWAAFLYVLGGYVVTQYVHDARLLIPAALGALVGTYSGTRKST